jgi:hypothetical protein
MHSGLPETAFVQQKLQNEVAERTLSDCDILQF